MIQMSKMRKQSRRVYRGVDGRDEAQVNQNELIELAFELGKHVDFINVGLNDDILIYNRFGDGPHIRLNQQNPRKYIIIRHTFATTWTNNVEVIFTDEDEEAEFFEDELYEYLEEEGVN